MHARITIDLFSMKAKRSLVLDLIALLRLRAWQVPPAVKRRAWRRIPHGPWQRAIIAERAGLIEDIRRFRGAA